MNVIPARPRRLSNCHGSGTWFGNMAQNGFQNMVQNKVPAVVALLAASWADGIPIADAAYQSTYPKGHPQVIATRPKDR